MKTRTAVCAVDQEAFCNMAVFSAYGKFYCERSCSMMRRMMRLDDAQDDAARSCYGTCEIRLDDAQEWTLVVNVPHVGQGKMRMTILSYPDDETAWH